MIACSLIGLGGMAALTGCSLHGEPQPFETGGVSFAPPGLQGHSDLSRFDLLPLQIERQLKVPPRTTPIDFRELERVKEALDSHFVHISDRRLYLKQEDWRAPVDAYMAGDTLYGDCDDYALMARAMLHKLGIPSRLVFAYLDSGEGHIFLEAGGWVIDNRMARVTTRDSLLGYRFVKISGETLQANWLDASGNNARGQEDRKAGGSPGRAAAKKPRSLAPGAALLHRASPL